MDDEARFVDAVNEIPDKVIEEVQAKIGGNAKEVAKDIFEFKHSRIHDTAFEAVDHWIENGGGEEAEKTGRKIADLAESSGILIPDYTTPFEHELIGSTISPYHKVESHQPLFVRDMEIFRKKLPQLYEKVNEERSKMSFSANPLYLGEAVINRAMDVRGNKWWTPIKISLEPLDENGRTRRDPVILEPDFVDVELDLSGIKYAREPKKVISGEVIYARLGGNNKTFGEMPPLEPVMKEEELRVWGFQKYKIWENANYVGKVMIDEKPVILGYAGKNDRYQLVNLPNISLKDAKPFVSVLTE